MQISQLFFQRYDPLYHFYLAGLWEQVPADRMRQRPHPQVNSIAWNLWHLTRVEDAGLNRFVTEGQQVLDQDGWGERLGVPWRHHGTNMTFEEVDQLDRQIDLATLKAYSDAVQARTRQIVSKLDEIDLDAPMTAGQLTKILVGDGLAHSDPEGFVQNYLGWTKGKCLFSFGLTHSWQHIGEIDVLASLLGVVFD